MVGRIAHIIYGNHPQGIDPIRDLAENVREAFLNSKLISEISFSETLVPNEINILVEEFSNAKFCKRVISLKKNYPKTIFILIITEIPINGSYNNFNNSKTHYKYQVNSHELFSLRFLSFKVYIFNKINRLINLFIDKKIKKQLKDNIIKQINVFINKIISGKTSEKINKSYIDLYFFARFHNSKVLIDKNIFTKIYIINSSSNNLMKLAFNRIFDEFPYYIKINTYDEKNELIFFSGTKTKERMDIFNYIESFGVFIIKSFNFNNEKREILAKKSLFSLHVSRYQGETEYSSPTRTLQALKFGTLTLPFKDYKESSLERMIGILSLTKLIEMNTSNNLQHTLKEHYYERLEHLNKIYLSINNDNKNRLEEILS